MFLQHFPQKSTVITVIYLLTPFICNFFSWIQYNCLSLPFTLSPTTIDTFFMIFINKTWTLLIYNWSLVNFVKEWKVIFQSGLDNNVWNVILTLATGLTQSGVAADGKVWDGAALLCFSFPPAASLTTPRQTIQAAGSGYSGYSECLITQEQFEIVKSDQLLPKRFPTVPQKFLTG